MEAIPFVISVSDAELEDLRSRLSNTRWPDRELVSDWSQGAPTGYVRELAEYWASEYDWREREKLLNRFDHYTGHVNGIGIHFIHQRSPHPEARPLLITHGWPGSIVEFHKVIEPLVDPVAFGGDASDAFHVIAPSLPGFGFSEKPTETGWSTEKIAETWIELMAGLGYDRYIAQGGDWGAVVSTHVAALDPEHCIGVHLNMPVARPSREQSENLTPKGYEAMKALSFYSDWESGYFKQQSTRPQTLGFGLADSPAGQLAWIVEKFYGWTENEGHPEDAITRDEILDNVMLYWIPNNATSSARIYWENTGSGLRPDVTVPMGSTQFPREILPATREWCENHFFNIVYWNEVDKGGHFAAFEVPEIFIEEVRKFVRVLEGL